MSNKYSYDLTAAAPSFDKLSKAMKESVDSLIETRVKIRKVHQMLSDVGNDASGVSYTDNYDDPDVRRVQKILYEMDHEIGTAFNAVESLERNLKKKAK